MDQQQTRLTYLYRIPGYQERDRFNAFCISCGKTPYFKDAVYGDQLPNTRFLIDIADTDRSDNLFLAGMGVRVVSGIRVPWEYNQEVRSVESHPSFKALRAAFPYYCIWPSTHALFEADHDLLRWASHFMQEAAMISLPTYPVLLDETAAYED